MKLGLIIYHCRVTNYNFPTINVQLLQSSSIMLELPIAQFAISLLHLVSGTAGHSVATSPTRMYFHVPVI